MWLPRICFDIIAITRCDPPRTIHITPIQCITPFKSLLQHGLQQSKARGTERTRRPHPWNSFWWMIEISDTGDDEPRRIALVLHRAAIEHQGQMWFTRFNQENMFSNRKSCSETPSLRYSLPYPHWTGNEPVVALAVGTAQIQRRQSARFFPNAQGLFQFPGIVKDYQDKGTVTVSCYMPNNFADKMQVIVSDWSGHSFGDDRWTSAQRAKPNGRALRRYDWVCLTKTFNK
jgi:hypothetical protein